MRDLERESRTVEGFQHVHAAAKVGRRDILPKLTRSQISARSVRHAVSHEGLDDPVGEFGVAQVLEGSEVVRRQGRPGFGNVKTAVSGQAGQQNVVEGKCRGVAAG